MILTLYKQARFAGYYRWLASFRALNWDDRKRGYSFYGLSFEKGGAAGMTITLTISEICQIILVVVALISLFWNASDRHNKKKK